MKKYTKVTIKPNRYRKYPFHAKLITFVMYGEHYMGAAESLVMYMGYNTNQYKVVNAVPCDKNGNEVK